MDIKSKLTSRKFWLSALTVIASICSMLGGALTGNEQLVKIGAVCSAVAAGIYSFCEALVDYGALGTGEDDSDEDIELVIDESAVQDIANAVVEKITVPAEDGGYTTIAEFANCSTTETTETEE